MDERNYRREAEKLISRVEEIMEAYSKIVSEAVKRNNPEYIKFEAKKYEKELEKLDPKKMIWNGLLSKSPEARSKLINLVIKLLKNKKLKPLN